MNRSHFAGIRSIAIAAGLLAVAARAEAQQGPTNLSLERFQPTPGNGRILAVPTSQTMGLWSYTIDVALDYAKAPLGSVKGGDLLTQQLTGQLLAGIGFGRLDVGLVLPGTFYQTTDPKSAALLPVGGVARSALGDLRLNAKVRLTPAEWIGGVALEALASFPTGNGAAFSGEGGFGLGGRVIGDVRVSRFQLAGYFGFRSRTTPGIFWKLYVRDELLAGLGAQIAIVPSRLWVFGNMYGSFGFHGTDVKDPMTNATTKYDADAATRPLEALLGLSLKTPVGVTLSVAAGAGIGTGSGDKIATSGYGTPQFRALAMVGFDADELDRDFDGLPDKKDACPTESGPEANKGCPTKNMVAQNNQTNPPPPPVEPPPVVATTEGDKKPAPVTKEPLLTQEPDEGDEQDGAADKTAAITPDKAAATTPDKAGKDGKGGAGAAAKGKGPSTEEGEGDAAGEGGKAGKDKAGKGDKAGKDKAAKGDKGDKTAKGKGTKGEGEEEADAATGGKSPKGKKGGKGAKGEGEGEEEADAATGGKSPKGKKGGKGAKGEGGKGEGEDEGGEEPVATRDRRGGGGGDEGGVARRPLESVGTRLADTGGPEVVGSGALGEKVYFALNAAQVEPSSVPVVTRIATELREHPEIIRVVIEGHADETGPDDYNQRLSFRRAWSVANTLLEQGVDSSRIEVRGYGSKRPLNANPQSREERAVNRRVEFFVVIK